MFRQTGTKLIALTPEYAKYFSSLPAYGGDRDRKTTRGKRRIAWLASKVESGRFMGPVWSITRLDGVIYRVDGGHSSDMLADYNGIFPQGLKVTVREFECDTPQDFADLFNQFDPKRSLRSYPDKINAHRATEETLALISATNIKAAIEGIAFYLTGCGEESRPDEDERVYLMHECTEFIQWAAPFAKKRELRRCGIMAAVYATHVVSVEGAADAFWHYVATEDHPNCENPTRRVAKFFTTSLMRTASPHVQRWRPRALYVKSIHAWNAWLEQRTTALKYHGETAPLPRVKRPRHGTDFMSL